jgi:hypothetical protein
MLDKVYKRSYLPRFEAGGAMRICFIFVVPRRGRRTFYLIIYLQLLIFDLKLKSGPESGPLRSEGRHLYSRINSKLTRATALTEWRQLLSE